MAGTATRIIFFGRLREAAGRPALDMELPPDVRSGADLVKLLAARDPAVGAALSHPSVKIVVDQAIGSAATDISNAREIAFLPPYSGG